MTWAVFKDSGETSCWNDQFMMKFSGFDKILTLSSRILTGILNGPKAFPNSSSLVVLIRN